MKWTHLIHYIYLPLIQLYFARQPSSPPAAVDDRADDLPNALAVIVEFFNAFPGPLRNSIEGKNTLKITCVLDEFQ
jgi:hypothetical protein